MYALAIMAIDLIVEKEVGSQTSRGIRIDSSLFVAEEKRRGGRLAIEILHSQRDFNRWQTSEEHRSRIPEADVLRALPDIEAHFRFPLADVAAVDLQDAVFQREAAQLRRERLLVEQDRIHPSQRDVAKRDDRLRARTV